LSTRTLSGLLVAVFAAGQDRIAKLERGAFVTQTMGDVAVGTTDERGRQLWVKVFVVVMILEARFCNILRMAFDAGLVLHRYHNRCRLLRQAGEMLEGVPRGNRNDLGPSGESFADVAVNTSDTFRPMME
jgi:hypothetical protein